MDWLNYFFGTDFSGSRETLEGYEVGKVFDEEDEALGLVSVLSEHDTRDTQGEWTSEDPENEFSVLFAEVVYNGANDSDLPTNALYEQVLILELKDANLEPRGRLYLQYN